MGAKLRSFYFDKVYNPAYDLTVGQLAPYRRFQEVSLSRLSLHEGDAVLCVGVGTGNEISRLLERNGSTTLSLVAVDLSRRGLLRARGKARSLGQELQLLRMDAHHLGFADGGFRQVLCLHTMDFLEDTEAASRELMRVLQRDGAFVISYPSGRGSKGLAGEIGKSLVNKLRQGKLAGAVKEAVATVGAAVFYLPLAMTAKPGGGFYTRQRLECLMASLEIAEYAIEEDPVYQDFIVWGKR